MEVVTSFAACRVDADLIEEALTRERRRDLRIWRGDPHWVDRGGPDGCARLVRRTRGRDVVVASGDPPLGSALYGYGAPAWCPWRDDAAVILTTRPLAVAVIGPDGSRRVTSPLDGTAAGYPCVLGGDVAVVVDRGPGRGRTLWCGSPGSAGAVVYETDALVSDLVVSPDGRRAAFIEWPVGTMAWDRGALVVAEIEGPTWRVRPVEMPGVCAQPRFVGAELVVDVEAGEWFHPHRVGADGPERIELSELDYRPDWSLGLRWSVGVGDDVLWCGIRESRSHQFVTTHGVAHPTRGGPDYVIDVDGDASGVYALGSTPRERGALWRLDVRTREWVRDGPPTPRRWSGRPVPRRSPAGVPYLWYEPDPPTHLEGRPGLLVMVHGGPTACTTFEFSWVIEFACRSGLAVASVDPRGSTSYGRTHRRALDGHWGEYDVDDVGDVLTEIVASGDVDPERVFVRGNSAGALSALLVATRHAVSGAVAVSAVVDPQSLFASTDEFDCGYAAQLTGGADLAATRSPWHHLDTMPDRVLVIHGAQDAIVPIAQASSMVDALRARGRDVTFVVLAGEGHSFRTPEANRRAFGAEVAFYAGHNRGSDGVGSVHFG